MARSYTTAVRGKAICTIEHFERGDAHTAAPAEFPCMGTAGWDDMRGRLAASNKQEEPDGDLSL
jgi:hypothetical protein